MSEWGYVAAAYAFVLSTSQAAPVVVLASRLSRGSWHLPAARLSHALALTALLTTPVGVLLLSRLPDWHDRPSIWLDWPGAPGIWHALALVALLLAALALGGLRLLLRVGGWRGTSRQWRTRSHAMLALGALYAMAFVFVHLVVSSDLALSLVPAWVSGVFPAYHAVSAFQGGVASLTLGLAVLRRGGRPIPDATLSASARLLLALALLWFYFVWSEVLTYWYGSTPPEQDLLALLYFGPALPLFAGAALLCFIAPVLLLMWNPLRRSWQAVAFVSAAVLIGLWLDRLRIYVIAWSVAGPVSERLEVLPAFAAPGALGLVALVGVPVLALLLVVAAARQGHA